MRLAVRGVRRQLACKAKAHAGFRKLTTVKSVPRTTIVFDIDDTICTPLYDNENDPECIIQRAYNINFRMYPHFKCLLELLLDQNCTIAFFSAACEERNIPLIKEYLSTSQMLGVVRYNQLKAGGQFDVFSGHHLKYDRDQQHDVKPLKPILKEGQTINDIMLVDDHVTYAASGEASVIPIPWPPIMSGFNTMYYLIGLFQDYFSVAPEHRLSIREYVTNLPKHNHCALANVTALVVTGLQEVRKTSPEAVFYFDNESIEDKTLVEKEIAMKDIVPSVDAIESILIKTQDSPPATFGKHLRDYFIPYYRDTLSDEEKQRLPERVKKMVMATRV